MFSGRFLILIFSCLGFCSQAFAAPAKFVYQGQIVKPNGEPLESSNVQFTIEILSPGAEQCLLYQERHILNLSSSNGIFTLTVGEGTRSGSNYEDVSTLDQAIDNFIGTVNPTSCASIGTYTASASDSRRLRITFDDGTGPITLSQDQLLQSVPYAQQASSVGGISPGSILQVNTSGSYVLDQTNLETVFDNSNFTELMALIGGTSTQYLTSVPSTHFDMNSYRIENLAAPVAGSDATNKDYVDQNIAGQATDTATLSTLGAGDIGEVLTWNGTEWTSSVPAGDSTKLPLAGGTMSGPIDMGAQNITNANNVALGNDLTVGNDASITNNLTVGASVSIVGGIGVGTGINSAGDITLNQESRVRFEDNDGTPNYVSFKSPNSLTADQDYELPDGDGGGGQVLATDGSGKLSWVDRVDKAGDSMTGSLTINDTNELRLADADSSHYVGFVAPALVSSNQIWVLPATDGSGGQVLTTNGSGQLVWANDTNTDAVDSVFGRTGAVVAASGDYSANQITNVAAGNIIATDVQGAIDELDSEKVDSSRSVLTGTGLTGGGDLSADRTISIANGGVDTLQLANDAVDSSKIADGSIATADIADDAIDASKLADTTVTAGSYGSATEVATFTVDAQGRLTTAGNTTISESDPKMQTLDSSEVDQLENIDAVTITNAQWGYLGAMSGQPLESVDGTVLDGVFSTNGLLKRTGAGTYVTVTDNSANWDSAYSTVNTNATNWTTAFGWGDHSLVGYALDSEKVDKAGDAMTGALSIAGSADAVQLEIQANATQTTNPNILELKNSSGTVIGSFKADGSMADSTDLATKDYVDTEIAGSSPVASVFGRTGAVVSATSDYDAVQIDNTASGNIAATNVQAAINELDTEKVESGRNISTVADSGLSGGGNLSADRSLSIDILGTTDIVGGIAGTDSILVYDASVSALREVSRTNFVLSESEVDSFVSNNGYGDVSGGANIGVGGVAVFNNENSGVLEFNSINSGSTKVTITDDTINNEVVIDVDESNFDSALIPNTPAGNIAATNTQAAIDELESEKLQRSGDSMTGALTMESENEIRFADNSGGEYVGFKAPATVGSNVIWTLPDADGAPNEVLQTDGFGNLSFVAIPSAPVSSVFGRTGAVVAATSDYDAVQIDNTASGNIASTNVQAAINELDTEKVDTARSVLTGTGLTGGGDLSADRTISIANGGVDTAQLANDAVDSSKIADGSIATVDIADDAIDASKLADTTVTAGSYGSATEVATFTVDAQGRLTAAGNTTISESDPKMQTLSSAEVDQLENIDAVTISNSQWGYLGAMSGQPLEAVDGTVLDGVFSTNGLLKRTGAGTYVTVTDNSANWDSAYSTVNTNAANWTTAYGWGDHGAAGYALDADKVDKAGDAMTGALSIAGSADAVQLEIQANATQTTNPNILELKNSGGTVIGSFKADGSMTDSTDLVTKDYVDTEIAGSSPVASVFGRTGAVVAATSDYDAVQIDNTAAGNIAATNVQAAINELDTEKVATTRSVASGSGLTGGGDLSSDRTLSIDIPGTTDIVGGIAGADSLLIYDTSVSALREVSRTNFVLSESEVDSFVSNNGYAADSAVFKHDGSVAMTGDIDVNNNDIINLSLGAAATPSLSFNADPNTGLFSPGPDSLALSTAGNEALTVDSSGNVGIGTNSPLSLLDVSTTATSDTTIRLKNGNYLTRFTSATAGAFSGNYIQFFSDGGTANDAYIAVNASRDFDIMAGSARFYMDAPTGNVGIGTNNPQSKLQVAGGVQIGSDAAGCVAGKAGTLRYNAGNVEYCNGATWEAFGTTSGGVPTGRLISTGTGLTGGGDLSADRTISIANGGVDTLQLANDAVDSSKIADGSIATADIADDAIDATKLADTTVTAGSYGSATQVATFTVDAQGRLTAAGNTTISESDPKMQTLTSAEVDQLETIDSVTITNTQWGYLGAMSGQPLESVDGTALDGVFSTNGLLKRTGANTYVTVTDNSANWDSAYSTVNTNAANWTTAYGWGDHGAAGYALDSEKVDRAGDSMTGALSIAGSADAVQLEIQANATQTTNVNILELKNSGGTVIGSFRADGSISANTDLVTKDYVDTEIAGSSPVASVFGRTGAVTAATSDYDAVQIDNTAAGNISATNVQAAINELDSEKVDNGRSISTNANSGLTGGGNLSADRSLSIDILGTTDIVGGIAGTDSILVYDVSTSALREVSRTNFVLSESEVDSFVSNNGYALDSAVFKHDGSVAMTGDIDVNNNDIINLSLGAAATPSLSFNADPNTGIFSPAPDSLSLSTAGNEALTIDSSGNIGIGTTSPLISANITTVSINGVDSGLLELQSGGVQRGALWYDTDHLKLRASGGSGELVFDTASSERMRINSSGNVGIGTNDPQSKLQVAGGVQLGTDAAACAATKAGTLRYNAGNVEYCDGSTWEAFGTSSGGVPTGRLISAGTGLTGGGDLSADRTISIANGGVDTAQLANDAVDSSKIADGSIATADIADDAIDATKLADTTVTAGSYGSATEVATFTVDAQGRLTAAGNTTISESDPKMQTLTSAEVDQLETIDSVTISNAQWGYLGAMSGQPLESVNGTALDGVFSTNGLLKRTGAGTYVTVTDNSANWDSAYSTVNTNAANWTAAYGWGDHGAAGYALDSEKVDKAGDSMTGALSIAGSADAVQLEIQANATQTTNPNILELKNSGGTVIGSFKADGSMADSTDLVTKDYVDTEIAGSSPVASVFGRTGAVVAATSDYDAVQIDNTAAGNIAATNVQAAINELDTEKVATTRSIASGSGLTGGGNLSADRTLSIDIPGTTDIVGGIAGTDSILVYDASVSALREVSRTNFVLSESEVDSFVSNNGYAADSTVFKHDGSVAMTGDIDVNNNDIINLSLGAAATPSLSFNADPNTGLFSPAPDSIALSTAGNEALTITATGLVGIGTTSPSELLDVGGKVKATQICIGSDCRSSWPAGSSSTDLITPALSYSASNEVTGPASNAADGNPATLWEANNNLATHWWAVDFTSDKIIVSYALDTGDYHNERVTNLYLEGSSTGAWGGEQVILDTWASPGFANDTNGYERSVTNSTGYRYYRLRWTLSPTGAPEIGEIRMFEAAGGSAQWTLSGGDLYYNSGNIGIGTNAPASALDVAGTIRTTEICDETGANCKDVSAGWLTTESDPKMQTLSTAEVDQLENIDSVTISNAQWGYLGAMTGQPLESVTGTVLDNVFSTNGLLKRTGAGTYVTITDNSANWDTAYGWGDHGAVGYAADSDVFKHDGSVNMTGDINVNNNDITNLSLGSAAAPSLSFNADPNTGLFSAAPDSLSLSTAGNEALTIDSSGRVGIGTSTPNSPLQLLHDFSTSATWHMTMQGYTTFSGTDASYNGGTVFDANFTNAVTGAGYSEKFGFSAAATTADDGDAQGASGFLANLKTFAGDSANGIYIADDNTSTGGSQIGIYIDLDDPDTSTYGIYQESANTNYFAGNVGIGTDAPQSALQVAGGVQIGIDAAACAATKAGTLRYNAGDVEYCDGSTWQAFGTSSGGVPTGRLISTGTGLTGGGDLSADRTIAIAAGGVGTTQLADDSVTAAKLADTTVTAGSYGSATQVATFTVDAQGRLTAAGNTTISESDPKMQTLSSAEVDQLETIDSVTISNAQWGYLGAMSGQPLESVTGTVLDNVFSTNGLLKRTGAGTYVTVTDNSANWDSAFGWGDHGAAGYAADSDIFKHDGTVAMSGDLNMNNNDIVNLALGAAATPSLSFNADPNTGFFSPAPDTLALSTAGNEALTIDSSGKVGIGTTTPFNKFEVVDNSAYGSPTWTSNMMVAGPADNYPGVYLKAFGGTTSYESPEFISFRQRGTLDTPTETQSGDRLGSLQARGWNSTLNNYVGASLHFEQSAAATATGIPTDIIFQPSDGSNAYGTERVRIKSNGNVGIGTNNPGFRLHTTETMTSVATGDDYLSSFNLTVNPTSNQTATTKRASIYARTHVPSSSTFNIDKLDASYSLVENEGSGDIGEMVGSRDFASNLGNANINTLTGNTTVSYSWTGDINWMNGSYIWNGIDGGTVNEQRGLAIALKNNGGTITDRYGILIETPTGTVTDDDYGIYQSGVGQKNYFAGNVGIGTVDPTVKLDVNGTVKATAFEGAITSSTLSAGDGSAGSPSMTFSTNNNTGFYSSALNQIGVSVAGSNIFDFTSNGLVSSTTGGATVKTDNGTAATPTFSFSGDEDTGMYRSSADNLTFATAGIDRLFINENGNVGIGSASTYGQLEVYGTDSDTTIRVINTDSTSAQYPNLAAINYMGSAGSGQPTINLTNSNGTADSPLALNSGDILGAVNFFGERDAAWNTNQGAIIYAAATENYSATNGGAHLKFQTTPNGSITPLDRMTIDHNGNVGIGTTGPAAKLHVYDVSGTSDTNVYVRKDFNAVPWGMANWTYNWLTGSSSSYNGATAYHVSGTNNITGTGLSEYYGFSYDGATANDAGEDQKIFGLSASMETHPNDTGFGIIIGNQGSGAAGNSTGGTQFGVYIDMDDTDVTNWGIYQNSVNDNFLAGDVGIGTDVINHKLTVAGNVAAEDFVFRNTNATPAVFDAGSIDTYVWNSTAGSESTGIAIKAKTNGSENYAADFSDNIYLYNPIDARANWSYFNRYGDNAFGHWIEFFKSRGTQSSPTQTLSGDDLGGISAQGYTSAGAWSAGWSSISFEASENYTSSAQGARIYFQTTNNGTNSATTKMTLDHNGYLGIGVTSPSHILHINGQGRATNSAWATTSDIRLKDIQGEYSYGLEEILNIPTYRFKYKKDNPYSLPSGKEFIGTVAQELQQAIPEAVEEDQNGYLTVNTDPVFWATINAVQELHGMCKMSEEQLAQIKAKNQEQDRRISSLEEENAKKDKEIEDLKNRLEKLEKLLLKNQ